MDKQVDLKPICKSLHAKMSSTISQSSSIPELLKVIRDSFHESDYNEVQNIIINREKNLKMEVEKSKSLAQLVKLNLEEKLHSSEVEKLKYEENLLLSDRKCEELEENVTRLREELTVSRDRVKRAEERLDKICKENLKTASEKLELNEKMSELKKKNMENERLLEDNMEKLKISDEKMAKICQEVENLRGHKSAADQTVLDLNCRLLKADDVIEELKRNVEDLRVQKAESDKSTELYKSRLESLAPRIMKVEESLANILNVKVEDLAQLVSNLEKPEAVEEGRIVEFPPDEKGSLGNGIVNGNVIIVSPGAGSTCNSAGSGCAGLSKKGGKNVDQTFPCQAEINKKNQDDGEQSVPDIIEICDSDDETNPNGAAAYVSPKGSNNIEKNEIIAEEIAHTLSSNKRNKLKRTDFKEESNINLIKKRKTNIYDDLAIDEKDNEILTDSEDDESCSEAHIENLLATIKSKKRWNFVAEMQRDFNEKEEILLEAVCALYRQQTRAEKSSQCSKLPKREGLSPKDSLSVRRLAEYLIDGDSELRQRKSISEVKQQKPDFVTECRRLAILYQEQVYKIYYNKEDPFFC